MPRWQGKSSGTTLGYKIFVTILQSFGLKPAYLLLRVVAVYYFIFARSGRYIRYYLRKRLGFSKGKTTTFLYKNYYSFGQSLIDKVAVSSGLANRFTFDFDGEDYLRQMVQQQKGGLLLSAHIGNWEAAGHLLERLETNINIVMFDGEHQQIKDYMDKVTGGRNANIIVIKNDLSHIYAINEAFAKNELVCMHADRFVDGNKTFAINLLGENARFPAGPFVLATQFKVPVSFVFAMKESASHYHFFATPPHTYTGADKKAGMITMAQDFASSMEDMLKRYPEQWYNYYDFWEAGNHGKNRTQSQ